MRPATAEEFVYVPQRHQPQDRLLDSYRDPYRDLTTGLRDTLVQRTMDGLSASPLGLVHPDHLASLERLVAVLADQALEASSGNFTLSDLDPGMGKTQVIVEFLRALSESPELSDVGTMIALSTKTEIKAYVDRLQLPMNVIGVVTSDPQTNQLGVGDPSKASIILTTHQMIQSRTRRRAFGDLKEFHFQGRTRQVRVWDEGMDPSQPTTLTPLDLMTLASALRPVDQAFAAELEALVSALAGIAESQGFKFPEFEVSAEIQTNEPTLNSANKKTLDDLRALSGSQVWLLYAPKAGVTVFGAGHTIPDDLAPILILDASGRVRSTYKLWERHRGNLSRVPAFRKRYDNLEVRHWKVGAGKGAFAKSPQQLIGSIADLINQEPGERWLIIHHKMSAHSYDLGATLRASLEPDVLEPTILTWGKHRALNDFKDYRRVVIAGLPTYPKAAYEGLARGAMGYEKANAVLDEGTEQTLRIGEDCHHLLQALCRVNVRHTDNQGVCGPTVAYLMAPASKRPQGLVAECFPGAKLLPWAAGEPKLVGRTKEAADRIQALIDDDASLTHIPFKSIRENLGMSASNFKNAVIKHPEFQRWLDAKRWSITKGAFVKAPPVAASVSLEPSAAEEASK